MEARLPSARYCAGVEDAAGATVVGTGSGAGTVVGAVGITIGAGGVTSTICTDGVVEAAAGAIGNVLDADAAGGAAGAGALPDPAFESAAPAICPSVCTRK